MGHDGTRLIPKCDGYIGKPEKNNKGVSQGSPLSATLFIIYAEQMMIQYNTNPRKIKRENLPTEKIRSQEMRMDGQSINFIASKT